MVELKLLDAARLLNLKSVLTMAAELGLSSPISVRCVCKRASGRNVAHLDQTWSNWGIADSAETVGYLTTRVFAPTNQYEVSAAIRQAEAEGRTIRALGSGWSFSDAVLPQSAPIPEAPVLILAAETFKGSGEGRDADNALRAASRSFSNSFGYAIDTSKFNGNLQPLLPGVLDDKQNAGSFFFVEAGMTLNSLNLLLDSQTPRVALKTLGGSSGQSIAGAISTGTHGGDFDLAPLADSVRAIYLVGAGGAHHWIEPTTPITDRVKIQATFSCIPAQNIHYDDDMFHAVLVSVGAMGVIYAVILDVVLQYSLLQWNYWSTWEALKDQGAPDFSGLFGGTWSGLVAYLAEKFPNLDLNELPSNRFVQVLINPIRNDNWTHNCIVTNRVMLPLQDPSGVQPISDFSALPPPDIENAIRSSPDFGAGAALAFKPANIPGNGPIERLQSLINFCKSYGYYWAIRTVVDLFMQMSYPESGGLSAPQVDIGYKIMASGSTQYAPLVVTSVEAAFNFPDVIKFINSALSEFDAGLQQNVFPAGYMSLRVCGRTAAFLGMERFDRNGMVEVSLMGNLDTFGLIKRVEQIALAGGGALHWGQSNGLMTAGDVQARFPDLLTWKRVQQTLGAQSFTNRFMQRCGLV